MKCKRIISILLVLSLAFGTLSAMTLSSFAWPKSGSQKYETSSMGGYGKAAVKLTLFNASEVSGNTATYYVDKYFIKEYKDLNDIYSVEFAMDGCILTTSIQTTNLDISSHYIYNNHLFNSENTKLTDTTSGYVIGDVPSVGTVEEFTITANISVTFKFNQYVLTDSTSVSANVRLVIVDSSELQAKIGNGDLLKSSCWTSSTFSNFSTALQEAKNLENNKMSSQEEIDAAATKLTNARNALVHNGSITECEYCTSEKTGMATTPISYRDVVYGSDPVRQCMDLFLPSNVQGDVSLILYIHGGGWIYGDKSEYTGRAYNDCLKYGVATLTISYRYTSEHVNGFDILDDMASALAKAKELGALHGLNIKQMMTYGGSAGGHLSLFYSYARQNSSPIQPVAAYSKCGPTNLTNKEYLESNLGVNTILFELGSMCGKYFTKDTMNSAYNELLAVSPINYVNANTVPTVICHGKKDITVPFTDSQMLDAVLTNYGVTHYYLAYPNTNHAIDIGTDPEYVKYADELFDQFVYTYLKNINPEPIHDYATKTVAKTCTSDGYTTYTCRICGEYHVGDIQKASHTVVIDEAVAPSCTQAGLSQGSHCSVCKAVLTPQTVIDAKGHTSSQPVRENEKSPSCAQEGSYDEVVYCSVCKAEISRTTKKIDKTAHTPGEWEVVTPATYTSEGLEEIKCKTCGQTLASRPIGILVPETVEITAKEGSGLVIDNEKKMISNVSQGTTSLNELLDFEGGVLEYVETSAGFGTGTKVIVKNQTTGEIVDTYTLVFPGDVTGDGFVDPFDVSVICSVANFETEFEEGGAFECAADLDNDGYVDSFDTAILTAIANFEF